MKTDDYLRVVCREMQMFMQTRYYSSNFVRNTRERARYAVGLGRERDVSSADFPLGLLPRTNTENCR